MSSAENSPSAAAIPWTYRWAVLALLSVSLFANYYLFDSLGMVADVVMREHKLSEVDYGLLSGAYNIAGALALLVGGSLIDRLGTKRSIVLFGALSALAGLLTFAAPHFYLLLLARFILGLGGEPLGVAVSTALARYWKSKDLAFAFGVNLTFARLGTVAVNRSPQWAPSAYAQATSRPALLIAAGIGLISLVAGVLNSRLEARAEQRLSLPPSGRQDRLSFGELRSFDRSYVYLTLVCLGFYCALFPFQSFATKIFIESHRLSRQDAGALLSYLPTTAMFLAPLFGLIVDRSGKRAVLLLCGLLLVAPVFPLLAIPSFPPQLPVLLLCLSFALIPAVLWPSVAMLVEENRLGTAYALMTLLQQLALWVTSALLGLCNERAQASAQHPQGYAPGLWLLGGLCWVALLAAFLLFWREQKHQPRRF